MLPEKYRPETAQPLIAIRDSMMDTIEAYCKEASIGSPEIIALNDVAEYFSSRARVNEVTSGPDEEKVAAMISHDALVRDIRHREVAIPGYAAAYIDLKYYAIKLRDIVDRIHRVDAPIGDHHVLNENTTSSLLTRVKGKITEIPVALNVSKT